MTLPLTVPVMHIRTLKPSLSGSNGLVQGTGFHLVVIQRPPGPYSQILEEFCELIAYLVTFLLHLKHREPVLVPVTQMFLFLVISVWQLEWSSRSEKLPGVLAPFVVVKKPVEKFTNEVNSVLVFLSSILWHRSLPRQDNQRNLLPGLLMKPEISSRPAGKWNVHGENPNWMCFFFFILHGVKSELEIL